MEKKFNGRRMLVRVGFYNAPSERPVTPYRIPQGSELVELITGGKVFFEENGVEKCFGKGAFFWHRSGDYTICRTPPEAPYRCVVFNFTVDGDVRLMPRINAWSDVSEVERFAVEALSLHLDSSNDKEILCSYVYGVLARHALLRSGDGLKPGERYSPAMRNLLDIIGANIQRHVSIAELSELCQISRPYIFRLFREEIGVTPHQYITSLQLDRAKFLLAGSARSIKEIAYSCGFESIEVFYRRFKSGAGQTPGEYRKTRRPYHFSEK